MYLFFICAVFGIEINTDFEVEGTVNCVSVESDLIESDGSITVDSSLEAESVSATYITSDSVTVSTITSPTGTLTIEANLDLIPSTSSSFIQRSWRVLDENSFENSHHDWSTELRSLCQDRYYLGGHCGLEKIYKKYEIPVHKYVRIAGNLHLLDLWKGEFVRIRADDNVVWSRRVSSHFSSVDLCGLSHPDAGFATKFDVMVPHTRSELMVTIESSRNITDCSASFGIGEISVLIR